MTEVGPTLLLFDAASQAGRPRSEELGAEAESEGSSEDALTDGDVTALWAEYKASGDADTRQQLIVRYSPLVKYVAGRVAVGLPQHVDAADLVSYGIIGLIDAIDRFDMGRAVKFEIYAIPRIRGAIIDELRAIDWVPRLVRAKARAVEQAYSSLEVSLLRTPSDAEVAEEMGISERDLQEILRQVSFVGVAALDEVFMAGGDRSERTAPGSSTAGPVALFEDKEAKEILSQAIARLGERERAVLSLYYYENLTLAEIGEVLGVTESRVCQIHTKAVLQLRSRLSDRRPTEPAEGERRGRGTRARRAGAAAAMGQMAPSALRTPAATNDVVQSIAEVLAEASIDGVVLAGEATGAAATDDLDPALWGPAPTGAEVAGATLANLRRQFDARRAVEARSIGRAEAADLLGVSAQAVTDFIEAGRLLALKRGRRWLIPAWQFDAEAEQGVVPGIADVARAFPGGPVALTQWVTTASSDLGGASPRDALAKGMVDEVTGLAVALTAAGW